jgi:hypothetical protein
MYEIYLDRSYVVNRLRELEGKNLRRIAEDLGTLYSSPIEERVVERVREDILAQLQQLMGTDLRQLAKEYGVYFSGAGSVSMSWIVNTLEACLDLSKDTLLETSFYDADGPWKIEWVPLERCGERWVIKNDFAITRIAEGNPLPDFLDSNLYNWITRQIIVGVGGKLSAGEILSRYEIIRVATFSLSIPSNQVLLEEIKADYDLIRAVTRRADGYSMLTGYMTRWLDPPLTSSHVFGVLNYWFHEM